MTRKDYIAIAEAFRVEYHMANLDVSQQLETSQTGISARGFRAGIIRMANELCEVFARDNARFDREHFLAVVRGERDLNSRPKAVR